MWTSERIQIKNGYDKGAYTYYPVAIIGAGESGIATACQLKQQLGFDQFRIFDRQAGLGGTWWINRYPGVACDVPTPFYSFSFRPNKEATELYPSGPELIRYFQQVSAEYEIIDKISLNTEVSEVRWLESEQQWQLKLTYMAHGVGDLSKSDRQKLVDEKGYETVYTGSEIIRARVVVSCCGGLVEPNEIPTNITGWDNFKGDVMHTARWKRDADFKGKDVVVVGSGCSAAQTVPNLIKAPYHAKSVTQIMRTAPWVDRKVEEPGGKENYAQRAEIIYKTVPGLHKAIRYFIAATGESTWFKIFGDEPHHRKNRKIVEDDLNRRMRSLTPKVYHDILTPNFSIGCKRRIFDRAWYDSLNDPRIKLTTQRLVSIGENSVHLAGGGAFPEREDDPTGQTEVDIKADTIVMANGFAVAEWLHPLTVKGRDGADLHETWKKRGGSQAYMGTAMDGFPNFFIIFGPNCATGHTSVIYTSENMVNYVLKFVRRILAGDARTVEVKKEAEVEYTRQLQAELKTKVFARGGCRSWYMEDTGWNSTMYPRSQWEYWLRCTFPKWNDWNVKLTARGHVKQAASRLARVLALYALYVAYKRSQKMGISLAALPAMLKMSAKIGVSTLLGNLAASAEQLQEKVMS